jgi:protein phosphatase
MQDQVVVDLQHDDPQNGDVYVLCSDGLSGMVQDPAIAEIASNAKSLERAVAELVDAANRNGGTDNVTTLLLQCLAA